MSDRWWLAHVHARLSSMAPAMTALAFYAIALPAFLLVACAAAWWLEQTEIGGRVGDRLLSLFFGERS